MGSGIVFSVGGLSSKQDLQRLRREERRGGKERRVLEKKDWKHDRSAYFWSCFLFPRWPPPVGALHAGRLRSLGGACSATVKRGHAVPSAESSEYTNRAPAPLPPSPRTHQVSRSRLQAFTAPPDPSCIFSACAATWHGPDDTDALWVRAAVVNKRTCENVQAAGREFFTGPVLSWNWNLEPMCDGSGSEMFREGTLSFDANYRKSEFCLEASRRFNTGLNGAEVQPQRAELGRLRVKLALNSSFQ